MNKPRRFRFKLATLFLLTAAISIVLGYTQWRRQNLLREIEWFEGRGIMVTVRDTGLSWLWPTVDKVAGCNYVVSGAKVQTASREFMLDEWAAEIDSSYDPLRDMGVEDIKFVKKGEERDWYYVSTTKGPVKSQ
jgi:hypothetical protein